MKKVISCCLALGLFLSAFTGCRYTNKIPPETPPAISDNVIRQNDPDAPMPVFKFQEVTYDPAIAKTPSGFQNNTDVIASYKKINYLLTHVPDRDEPEHYIDLFRITNSTEQTLFDKIWGATMLYNPENEEHLGYAIKDIDQDGIQELILLLDDLTVLAIITESNGTPVLLDWFWPRKSACISPDGHIIVCGSGGASYVSYYIYEIQMNDVPRLHLLKEFGINGEDVSGQTIYYDDQYERISADEFDRLFHHYIGEEFVGHYLCDYTQKYTPLDFIAIS